jgi:hypothetical protein
MAFSLLLASLLGGCLADSSSYGAYQADDLGERPVAEGHAALTRAGATEAAPALDTVSLPRWSVTLLGQPYDADDTRWQWKSPAQIDRLAGIAAVRSGDEANPRKWIVLELEQHWMLGDRYFRDLMREHGLTLLDLVMIQRALLDAGDDAPRREAVHTRDCYECGSSAPGVPSSPLGGSDHTGPAPGAWGPPKPPSPAPPRPQNGGKPAANGQRRPPLGPKEIEEIKRKQLEWSNGIRPGDPIPRPAPTDAGYEPAPKESKEPFKCEGGVYYGFRGGCVDFQAMAPTVKWALKLGLFLDRAGEALQREVLHTFFHDGKGEACRDDCTQLGIGAAGVGATAIMFLCVAATRGLAVSSCINGMSGAYTALGAATAGTSAGAALSSYCSKHVCTK